jgi:hypothetical protein
MEEIRLAMAAALGGGGMVNSILLVVLYHQRDVNTFVSYKFLVSEASVVGVW